MISPRVGLVVLAAGASRRFGAGDKLMAGLQGAPLCSHIARTGATLDLTARAAVVSDDQGGPAEIFATHGYTILANERAGEGLSTSLGHAARFAGEMGLDGLIVCLADMPFVTGDHLIKLAARWQDMGRPPAIGTQASGHAGSVSPPAIFGTDAFPHLLGLRGDRGARGLLAQAQCLMVNAAMLADFDTHADFSSTPIYLSTVGERP